MAITEFPIDGQVKRIAILIAPIYTTQTKTFYIFALICVHLRTENLQTAINLNAFEDLDLIAFLHLVILHANTAFGTGLDFIDIVLDTAQ